MELFLQTALSFPTAIYSFLLCVAVIYWLVVAAGLLEVDLLDVEADSMMEGGQTEGLAGLLYRLKLDGVPVTLVLTLLFFFAWFACYFIELWLLRHLPLGILRYPFGLVVIAGAFVLLSLALGAQGSPVYQSDLWLWFTAFVGINLLQSGLTKWCLMESILAKLGLRRAD